MTDEEKLEAMRGTGSPRWQIVTIMRDAVAEAFTVTPDDISGRSRTRGVIEARQCLYLVARSCTRMSYPELAQVLRRDHSTILDGVRAAQKRSLHDAWYDATTKGLMTRFSQ